MVVRPQPAQQLVGNGAQGAELLVIEQPGNGLLNDIGADELSLPACGRPGAGEDDVDLAAVAGRAVPLDPAAPDEAVDNAGQPAGRDP